MSDNSEQNKPTKLSSIKTGGRTVLTPQKSITHENCEEIRHQISSEIEQHKTEIIIDCKAVPYLDSAALELLLWTHDELKSQGGTLKILGLNAVCRDILVATRLKNALNIYEDLHKAVMGRP